MKHSELCEKSCIACAVGTPPIKGDQLKVFLQKLGEDWSVIDEHHIEKDFKFKNFREALNFTNKVGELAEKEGHHPDIMLSWGRVRIVLYTHKIDGLSESDFIFAAKCDEVY